MEHPYSVHDRSTATHTVRRNYHTQVRPPQAIASPGTASIETDIALLMDLLMYGIDAALIALGLAGLVVPCCRAFHWTSSQERWLATYGSEPAGENFKCSITGRKAILPTLVRLTEDCQLPGGHRLRQAFSTLQNAEGVACRRNATILLIAYFGA
jgi:hypothetical protein